MVTVQKSSLSSSTTTQDSTRRFVVLQQRCLVQMIVLILITAAFYWIIIIPHQETTTTTTTLLPCPYTSLHDFTKTELHPTAGARHQITPPVDTKLTAVCCWTTAGPLTIVAHEAWAQKGAQRFIDMVRANYFHKQVPLMRCVHNFICQFGLAGPTKQFHNTLPDDVNWMPTGKEYRQNEAGVKRFARGYLAYAGSGPNSRTNQFIVALADNGRLGGGSPWEVPWGEVVGQHSFDTLSKIYTGYGENGPKQGKLHQADYVDYVKREFPKLDWIQSCHVIDERVVG